MTLKGAFSALKAQSEYIYGIQQASGTASSVELATMRRFNDAATNALFDFMDAHDIPVPPATPPVVDPPSGELRPPVSVDEARQPGAPSTVLTPVDLGRWNQRIIESDEVMVHEHLTNFEHIALHHGSKSGVLTLAKVLESKIGPGGKWAGRLYRVGSLVYESCTIKDISPEHGTYVNVAGGGLDPVDDVCLRLHLVEMWNIGGQAVQTVLEERSIDDPFGGDPMLRINETPDWESDITPGGWLLVDRCSFTATAQHDSRGSFAISHFRSRHHVAVRATTIDNRSWAYGARRDVCRGHLMVQGCEEYRDGLGTQRPAWDRHVLVEDCEFYGHDFNQPLMLLEKGLHDIRIRRCKSRSTGGQDFVRIRGFDTSRGQIVIEDWDGPGHLELNGKNVGRLDKGFIS